MMPASDGKTLRFTEPPAHDLACLSFFLRSCLATVTLQMLRAHHKPRGKRDDHWWS